MVVGHGQEGAALCLPRGPMLTVQEAASLVGKTANVVLSVCGSAIAPPNGTSLAEETAASGAALVLGFQDDINKTDARELTKHILERVGASARTNDAVSLATWETALTSVGKANPAHIAAAVLYAHPALLAGASTLSRVKLRQRVRSAAPAKATATCWGTPGQVTCFAEGERKLRLPLPVDVGVDVCVTVGGSVSGWPSVLQNVDITAVVEAFDLGDASRLHIALTAHFANVPWAWRTAVLSATIRALSHLHGDDGPGVALSHLRTIARDQWGALDAVPRLLDIATGDEVCHPLGNWPDLSVRRIIVGQSVHTGSPPNDISPTLVAEARPSELAGPLTVETTLSLANAQQQRFARGRARYQWIPELVAGQSGVLVPARATVSGIDAPDGRGPRLRGMKRTELVSASDHLY